jgi:monovalent cation:H+ antiporter-2, CPA2 family
MHALDFILTLAGGFAAALLCGYITHRLGLSPIVGYLFAGIAIGPHTPGFVADQHLAEQLAEVGVILLMFGVGLQFHIEELLAVRRIAIPGALVQSVSATILGALVGRAFGWSWESIKSSDDVSRRRACPPYRHSGAKDRRRIRSSTTTLKPKSAQASTRPISP